MKKRAAPKATSTKFNENKQARLTIAASNNFIVTALSMSWQLAFIFLVPIIGGYELDNKLHSDPWLFIIGLVIALTGSILFMRHLLTDYNYRITKRTHK